MVFLSNLSLTYFIKVYCFFTLYAVKVNYFLIPESNKSITILKYPVFYAESCKTLPVL